ncbi:centriolin isoform X3 [Coregonus clupeaformis]|uniref:centriolin isoform X3 n=1 Tax=Coregonus clupeaformis TaxID=59861 RepID=UPI001E1C5053|nr:centriolin isoform X3 [Coregonus clupeaformis]
MKKGLTQRISPRRGAKASLRIQSPGSPLSDPYSLTPSPTRLPLHRTTHSKMDSNHQLDITYANEDWLLAKTVAIKDEESIQGIRYITEDLISRLTKQDKLAFVRSLNLAITKSGDKKFKFIENLEKCERLQVLNVSHNVIEKIEKLEKLHNLRELHVSNNRIHKIEGLEHMASLQLLNLSSNDIEHVPLWLAKKLRSLQTLNLQRNKISSLQELSRLKPLKNLTELTVAENPIANLPHYRLFLVFHLRSLEMLDGQPISQEEREQAHQRFQMEEIERLEQDLECRVAEIGRLQSEQAVAVEELEQQDALIDQLQLKSLQEQHCQAQQEQELDTKTELLKQKTMELTRACQKQYELEQELAFQKIDAKFEPYPYYPDHELEAESLLEESPYIGKARHKRNAVASDGIQNHQMETAGHTETDNPRQDASKISSRDCSQEQTKAEQRLQQLHREIEEAEQHVLRAGRELRQLEETLSQKQVSEAEKEQLRQQLHRRIQQVRQLRDDAEALEGQLEMQRGEMSRAQGELDHLQGLLDTLDPRDPQHAHVKAQVSRKSQLLDMMSRKHRELEGRLDGMLSRIAKETEEIKDLEQQLTDGQIAANEALKRDLEGIISGLQEYLSGMKEQARRAQADCHHLQREMEALQRCLDESQEQRRLLEIIATANDTDKAQQQQELDALRRENAELRRAQGQISAYEAELESQLQERHTEAGQLKEELGRLRRLSQLEHAALQAALDKERQSKDNAQAQLQLTAEREQQREELLEQLTALQEDKASLEERVGALQSALQQARGTLLCPQEVQRCLEEMIRTITSGQPGHIRASREGGVVGRNLERLQREVLGVVSAAQTDRDQAQQGQAQLSQELASLREQHKAACQAAAQATQAAKRLGEEEILWLREELQEARELQKLTGQRLQEAEDKRGLLLAELEEQDKQMEVGECRTQQQLRSLDMELRELRSSFTTADKMAAQQLSATKEQLSSLHTTVEQINQERAEDAEELEGSRVLAAEITQNLTKAEAEIQLLQNLLKDRMHLMDRNSLGGISDNSIQQQELDRLKLALTRQEAQTKRLREQLALARERCDFDSTENSGHLEELMGEVGALRENLVQQNQVLSSLRDPHRTRGHWYYVPSSTNAPSLGSQGTQDSGLGLQYPSSPDKGHRSSRRRGVRRDRGPQPGGGYWVYSPPAHTSSHTYRGRGEARDSGGESDVADCSSSGTGTGDHFSHPPGSAIYTMLPDGSPLPPGSVIYAPPAASLAVSPGTVIYGPPPQGAHLVYGPSPSSLSGPWLGVSLPTGVLHCNMPGHQEMERELARLEQLVEEQQRGSQGPGEEERQAHVERDVLRLQEQRTQLRLELRELRRALSQLHRRRREVLEGRGGSEVVEESLRHHGALLDEVECLEKTLLRRRAELREADRLLLEAQSSLKETRTKNKETLQQHTEARKRLVDTERNLEEMELRARDSASLLVEAKQHLRDLQEELQELRKRKEEQGDTLQRVEQVVAARDLEFQEVNKKVKRASERLEDLRSQLLETQSKASTLLDTCKQSESTLAQRRSELERLNIQGASQQEELSVLDRRLGQWREEEWALQERKEQQRLSLEEALRQGEEETHELHRRIKALQGDVELLYVQKGELEAQLTERRASVAALKQQGDREEEIIQSVRSQINKHKAELKHVLEMLQMEAQELQGVKLRHDQHLDQLERSQESLLQVRVELQALQQEVSRQMSEGERQRRLAEQDRKELEELREEAQGVREQVEEATRERSRLEEQCRNLEARRTHADRCLEAAEEGARGAKAELDRLQAELGQLRQEQRQAHTHRQKMERDTAATQQQLYQESERFSGLKEQVEERRRQLEMLEEEVRVLVKGRDSVAGEEQEARKRLEEDERRAEQLEHRLMELHTDLAERQTQIQCAQRLQCEAKEREERQRQRLQELQAQSQVVESSLTQHTLRLEQVTTAVADMEDRSRQAVTRDHKQCAILQERVAQLGQELCKREAQLQERAEELLALQEELGACRAEVQGMQEERRSAKGRLQAQKRCEHAHREKLKETEQLRGQEEGESRLREIREAMRGLKTDVKAELNSGMVELTLAPDQDPSSSDTDNHKENYPHYSTPAVPRPAYNPTDEQWRGEVLRERLRQQEDLLKAQLRRRMWSQEEFLSQRRQQTEGSLQGLRRRVDKLGQLLGNCTSDSLSLSSTEPPLKQGCPDAPERWCLQESAQAEVSHKPVRLDPTLPEKEPGPRLSPGL